MKKTIERGRTFGSKVVKYSPWEMLLAGVAIVLGHFLLDLQFRFTVAMFLLGMVLSPLLVKQYRTGKPVYAGICGTVLGLSFAIIYSLTVGGLKTLSTNGWHGLYGALCVGFGSSVVFVALRKRLIHYIRTGNW